MNMSSEFTFTPKTISGDIQCTAVGIIDNNLPDSFRFFEIRLLSLDPRVRVFPEEDIIFVDIADNDRKLCNKLKKCTQIDY